MNFRMTPRALASLTLAMSAMAMGCGDGENNNPGPGPGVQIVCGAGTTLDGSTCVPSEQTCGDGQVFDATTRTCVLDPESLCDEGTTFVAETNSCVPNAEVCADGTSYDDASGRCVADVTCGDQTIAVDGVCIPREDIDETMYTDEEAGENDPAFGGSPQELTLPAVADSILVRGTLSAPADLNEDGRRDQDIDVYSVELTAGDALRIQALRLGSGAYGFEVRGPSGYYRQGPRYASEPDRTILALEDGTHTITVRPQATLFDPLAGPTGSPQDQYILAVENLGGLDLDAATPYDLTSAAEFTSAWSDQAANVLKLEYPADAVIDLSLDASEDDVLPQFVLLNTAGLPVGTLTAGETRALLSGGLADSLWVMIDYIELGQDTNYTLRTSLPSTVDVSNPLQAGGEQDKVTTDTIPPGGELYISVQIAQEDTGGQPTPNGQIVRMTLTALNPNLTTELEIYSPSNRLIKQNAGLTSTFFAQEEGTYLVRVRNRDEISQQGINQVSFESEAPVDMGELTAGGSVNQTATIEADAIAYFVVDAATPLSMDAEAAANGEVNLSYYTEDLQIIANAQGTAPEITDLLAERAGPRAFLISNLSGAQAQATLTVTATGEPSVEVEPNDRAATAQEVDLDEFVAGALGATDVDTFAFTPSTDGLFRANVRAQGTSTLIRATLRNARLDVLARSLPSAGLATAGAVLRAGETYYVTVSTPILSSFDTEYSVFIEELPVAGDVSVEPNDSAVTAQALTAAGGAWEVTGTVEGLTDEDWYSIDLASPAVITLGLEDALANDPFSVGIEAIAIEGDGTTEVASDGLIFAAAGTTYVRVRSLNNRGEGNSYRLRVEETTSTDLGALSTSALDTTGTLNASGEAIYSFTVGATITSTATRRPVVWSDRRVDVYASDGALVHESIDSGQFFSSDADPSFSPDTLAAGTYFVLVSGAPNQAFRLVTGDLTGSAELAANDDLFNSPAAGALAAGVETIYFGEVGPSDQTDYLTVTVPDIGGADQTIYVEHYQLGTTVADLDLAIYNSSLFPAGNATETPQVLELTVSPGDYIVEVRFIDDLTNMASGEYALRVGMR
jgi:hypothetical protein